VTRTVKAAAIVLVGVALVLGGLIVPTEASECIKCHTNPEKLKEITAYLAAKRPTPEDLASISKGPHLTVEVEPMAPYEKLLVGQEFLKDAKHDALTCEGCHLGDPDDPYWKTAHGGIKRDPSFPAPGVCAKCHEDKVEHYATSLHYTDRPKKMAIKARASEDEAKWAKLEMGVDSQCLSCHSSCGNCHVSRPAAVGGGLLDKHNTVASPPMEETCLVCHGSTTGVEYLGQIEGLEPDVHFEESEMACMDCHNLAEMHGDGQEYDSRYDNESAPACMDCHDDIYESETASLSGHNQHQGKVSCQVCHAQAYVNCSGCHVGQTEQGRRFYEVEGPKAGFYIGRNPAKNERHPENFVTVRQAPVAPDTFKFYVRRGLSNFDQVPTFKLATPHNIRRVTTQNSSCNNCHGNEKLFLKGSDMDSALRKANRKVMAVGEVVPEKVREPESEE